MTKKITVRIIIMILLGMVGVVVVFPFYSMIMMSTYSTPEIFRGIRFTPGDFFLRNARTLLSQGFMRYYRNSAIVALGTSFLSVFVSAMGGYALGIYQFKGKKAIMGMILVTLMIPMQIAMIGIVMQVNFMGLADTHLILILLGIPSAFGVFWMSSFSRQAIPLSILESAYMDGSSDFMTFVKIGLPLLMPACGTLFLLVFLGSWNSFMMPMVLLSSRELFTMPLGIMLLANNFGRDVGAQLAGLTLGTVPILIIFASFSKTLIQGISAAAIKE